MTSQTRFAVLPARAYLDPGLGSDELRLLGLIGSYADRDGWCFPSLATLAEQIGAATGKKVSASTVSRRINGLVEKGYVNKAARYRKDKGQTSNLMQVRMDWPAPKLAEEATPPLQIDAQDCKPPLQGEPSQCKPPLQIDAQDCKRTDHSNGPGNGPGRQEKPAAPPKPKQRKQENVLSKHPAIMAFREVTGKYPREATYHKLIEVLGDAPDIAKLRDCWVDWNSRGFNPCNLAWATDWYVNGKEKKGNANGRSTQWGAAPKDSIAGRAGEISTRQGAAYNDDPVVQDLKAILRRKRDAAKGNQPIVLGEGPGQWVGAEQPESLPEPANGLGLPVLP